MLSRQRAGGREGGVCGTVVTIVANWAIGRQNAQWAYFPSLAAIQAIGPVDVHVDHSSEGCFL